MADAGFPEYTVVFWQGVAGPAGLPRDIVNKLNAAYNAALKNMPDKQYDPWRGVR